MRDSAIVKCVAIGGLVVLECVNLFTARLDGALLFSLGAIIGGIAGYELKRPKAEEEILEEEELEVQKSE